MGPDAFARAQGYLRIVGIDEAGRGPLAGPVVAAAIILPHPCRVRGIADSKLLTADQRAKLYKKLIRFPHAFGIVDNAIIDEINIHEASLRAMRIAVSQLGPDYLLIDGLHNPNPNIAGQAFTKGERFRPIGAASILAKVHRDRLMDEAHRQWPEYGFNQHKGYGTLQHREALERLGPCPIHRMSFQGVLADDRLTSGR